VAGEGGLGLRIYLDACCLSRLTDDQTQPRILSEAEAVEGILTLVRRGSLTWVSSSVLNIEVARNPNAERRRDAEALLIFDHEILVPSRLDAQRARRIEQFGFGAFDALHLASAERGSVDVFLTTDDQLIRRAQRSSGLLHLRVENPVSWYLEVRI
jgi:predicted nucleic acid-binding protein